jgi:hypothetical protein
MAHALAGQNIARIEVDGAKTVTTPGTITRYAWFVNGKPVSEAAQAHLELPVGPNRVGLEVIDKSGAQARAQSRLMILPHGAWRFGFGARPETFLEGNRDYSDSLGYGWEQKWPANAYTRTASYDDPANAYGCGHLILRRPVDFKLKVPPGTYTLQVGGAVKKTYATFGGAVAVSGKPVDVSNRDASGYRWQYEGHVEPDAQGYIRLTFTRTEQQVPLLSYLIVRRQ